MRSSDPTLPSITFVLSQAQPPAHRSSKRWNRFGVRRSRSSPSFAPHPPRYPPRLDSEFLTVNPSFLTAPTPTPIPFRSDLRRFPNPPVTTRFVIIADSKQTVDYRFSSPPPSRTARSPSRSSFALPKDIFDADAAEIEIVMPSSPTESESSTESTVGCSSSHTHAHSHHHDGSHAHHRSSHRRTESLCCGPGPGSSRRRGGTRAVTAFIHDALSAFRSIRMPGMQTVRRAEQAIPFDLCN
ncbi:hypothetical protein V8E53_006193 [Lactarius tabidus]